MAIITSASVCPLCETALRSASIFATSGVFLPPGDPLWRFCDAGMHWDCYARWPHRRRFAKAYIDAWVGAEKTNPYWGRAHLDERVFVTIRKGGGGWVSVRLFETGSAFQVELRSWSEWVANPTGWEHPVEHEALLAALPRLRAAVPTSESLLAPVDWDAKQRC